VGGRASTNPKLSEALACLQILKARPERSKLFLRTNWIPEQRPGRFTGIQNYAAPNKAKLSVWHPDTPRHESWNDLSKKSIAWYKINIHESIPTSINH